MAATFAACRTRVKPRLTLGTPEPTMIRLATIAAALLLSAGEAFAHGHDSAPAAPPPPKSGAKELPAKVVSTGRGTVLADPKGMTLYYFDKDDSGNKSNCNGKCTER